MFLVCLLETDCQCTYFDIYPSVFPGNVEGSKAIMLPIILERIAINLVQRLEDLGTEKHIILSVSRFSLAILAANWLKRVLIRRSTRVESYGLSWSMWLAVT